MAPPVKANQILLEWDPYTFSILTEVSGAIHFKDLSEGLTLQEQVDEITGMSQWVVMDAPDEKRQPTLIVRPQGGTRSDEKRYLMPTHAHLMVQDGEEVHAGDVLAKIPRATTKTKDITGGLPRVVELFEARKPRETAVSPKSTASLSTAKSAKVCARFRSWRRMASSAITRSRAVFTSTCRKASASVRATR